MGQLGFYFNPDNCIGCHSCEAACSEKNDLPPEVAWRKVGVVEQAQGEKHDFRQMFTSMSCNHCENPVCLYGCPTQAYTKDKGTGLVIVDSDTCIGCKYCTWVCPYNAPAFNPAKGSVSKCDGCYERVGSSLKPACVNACLAFALDFSEIETMPQIMKTNASQIPEMPDPAITSPSIRFRQEKPMDVSSISRKDKYTPGDLPPLFTFPHIDHHEIPLVFFTILTQVSIGSFVMIEALDILSLIDLTSMLPLLYVIFAMIAIALGISTAHLGKPLRAYRALKNVYRSWVSREVIFLGGFTGLLGVYIAEIILDTYIVPLHLLGIAVSVTGILGIWSQIMIYLIPARPYWNSMNTVIEFTATAFTVPALIFAVLLRPDTAKIFMLIALGWIVIQEISLRLYWQKIIADRDTSPQRHTTLLRITGEYRLFWLGLMLCRVAASLFILMGLFNFSSYLAILGLSFAILAEFLVRLLFYIAVVPLSMPPGVFYKNKLYYSKQS